MTPKDLESVRSSIAEGTAYSDGEITLRGKKRNYVRIEDQRLRAVQERILDLLRPSTEMLPDCVHGYVSQRSTVTNASQHTGAQFLQLLDIEDFFPSITEEMVEQMLIRAGLRPEVAKFLLAFMTRNGSLPLGAVTSPAVSNLVFAPLDAEIVELTAPRGIVYTRYADDLAFSSVVDFDLENEIDVVLRRYGLALNRLKSSRRKRGQGQRVTALAVGNAGSPRLSKRRRRELRQLCYMLNTWGVAGLVRKTGLDETRALRRGAGLIAYAKSVEPDLVAQWRQMYPRAFEMLGFPAPGVEPPKRGGAVRVLVERIRHQPRTRPLDYEATARFELPL
jgi:RNA-directed DNA polymerase